MYKRYIGKTDYFVGELEISTLISIGNEAVDMGIVINSYSDEHNFEYSTKDLGEMVQVFVQVPGKVTLEFLKGVKALFSLQFNEDSFVSMYQSFSGKKDYPLGEMRTSSLTEIQKRAVEMGGVIKAL
ncbi:MAG: hypothetical protein CMJ78_00235 [Planctomycetaceae bacterium]|nr:hypothetical protein [Planctomycetaceae bacterium]